MGEKAVIHAREQSILSLWACLRPPPCCKLVPAASGWCRLTNLSRGDDVLVFGVLVDSQAEDVVSVFQVEALCSCQHGEQSKAEMSAKAKIKKSKVMSTDRQTGSG